MGTPYARNATRNPPWVMEWGFSAWEDEGMGGLILMV